MCEKCGTFNQIYVAPSDSKLKYILLLGCGGIYRKSGHSISPPMGGSGYQHGAKCTWIIVAPVGQAIQLSFSSFSLEVSNGCYFDSLTIYDGYTNKTGGESKKPIGTFCGLSIPGPILSTGNVLSMVFESDDSASSDGFLATYDFIDGSRGKFFVNLNELLLLCV